MPVKNGDKVKVDYVGTFEDGTEFDNSSKHGQPLEFEVGAKMVVPGFENAVIGMEKGDEKEFKLTPKEGYGDPNPELVQRIPKDKLPPEAKPGMVLGMQIPGGGQMQALVKEIGDTEAVLDLNHPLAGKTLCFKIKIVDIN